MNRGQGILVLWTFNGQHAANSVEAGRLGGDIARSYRKDEYVDFRSIDGCGATHAFGSRRI